MTPSRDDPGAKPRPRVGSFRYLATEDSWDWSDAVFTMHGYQPDEITPTTELILKHKHPEDRSAVTELLELVRRHQAPFSSRHRIIDTHGEVHWVIVVGDRLYAEDAGQVIGTSGFYVDITESFDAEVQDSVNEVVAELQKSRAVINQAMGVLMGAYGVSAERAFEILTWRSQETNVKVRVIAQQFMSAVVAASLLGQTQTQQLRATIDHLLLTAHQGVQ